MSSKSRPGQPFGQGNDPSKRSDLEKLNSNDDEMSKPSVGPYHSIAHCPVCGGGLCGVRLCSGDDPTAKAPGRGFIMCDECEAVWLEPEVSSEHLYVDPEDPACPICHGGLWATSQWATAEEIEQLGWTSAINHELDASTEQS